MPDRDAIEPPASRQKLRDVVIRKIRRQPRIDAGDIRRHAVEEIDARAAQQRIQDRLVDLGRPVSRRQRRDIFLRAGLDLRRDA